jgi:NADPH-dependent F420 reductase
MEINSLKVGLIGGTGEEGKGLALRFARAGAQVTIGSRSLERAKEAADEVNQLVGKDVVRHALNSQAVAEAEFVLLTVPFQHAVASLDSHRGDFQPGSILVDITVPVSFDQGRVRYVDLPEGSASEHLKLRLPDGVSLVAAFKTEPAHLLVDPEQSLDCDVFIAGDQKESRERVIDAVKQIDGARPIDAGPLYSARALERMTVLAIGINRRYKIKNARYRLVGLP